MRFDIVNPSDLGAPKGFNHGLLARPGVRMLFVAGQIGTELDGGVVSGGFPTQFGQALKNVVAVVRMAGGSAPDIARLTIYVTDMEAYRNSLAAVGTAYREIMGRHFPAIALVGVSELVHPDATVEIEATAMIGD